MVFGKNFVLRIVCNRKKIGDANHRPPDYESSTLLIELPINSINKALLPINERAL
jgi:hypothetical protein